jgi:hypothetical protein
MKDGEEYPLAVAPKKSVKTIYKTMNIDDLHFYPDNPRISSVIIDCKREDLTDESIYKKMEEKQKDACNSLYQDVKRDGQINEPLIIYQNQALEGNTRLWVSKTLYKDTNNAKWKLVPCRVVEGELDHTEINYILCSYHIKKKKDWIPFEKACYFYRMNAEEGSSIKDIAELTGEGQKIINDFIKTFKAMKIRRADRDQWSYYYETLKEAEVTRAMKEGVPVLNVLERGIKKGEISDAQDVRKFKRILKDKVATKKLVSGEVDIHRAERIAVTRNPEQDDEFLRALLITKDMLVVVNLDKIENIKKSPRKLEIVKDFLESVKTFSKFMNK